VKFVDDLLKVRAKKVAASSAAKVNPTPTSA
jgi:hypothetical protein